ncbi:MAG: Mu transposase C-terminal domain-containing protein [Desulfovibrio sp.]|nr:Mu transposase C-terminal domain-containing protein [Desulfovibrio sp.]
MALKEAYTAQELAILLGCAVQSATRTAKREKWQSRKRTGRGGGNEWLVSSIPEATRNSIQTSEERKAIEEEAAKSAELPLAFGSPQKLQPQKTVAILDDKRRYKALAKADLLDLYLNWQRKYGATVAQKEAFILAYQGGAWSKLLGELGPRISWKSLERWKLERKESGTVLCLADGRGLSHRGKSMLTEQHKSIILGQVMDGDRQISTCIRIIQARCQAENIAIPSEDTIRRWVTAYSKASFQNWTLFRKGEKAWNDSCAMSILRDWSLVEVGDIVIADGHTLNFETINPETGKPCRMTLLLYFDGASRYPLGWEVMATENTQCIASAFRRACIRLGKFPRVVYLDNGKAFRSRFFKGCSDFEQAGFLGLYRDLGCEVIHAWPYHGQSKPVERFFGTMHEMEELTPSYTGWNIAHKPARLQRNEKLHRKLHEKLGRGPLTLEETHYWLASWFEMYASRPQTRTHLKGKTPGEVFLGGRGPGVDMDKLTLLMLQKEVRTISKDGIRMFGRLYWSEELSNRRHPVLVRYDLQLSPYTVLVYDLDGNKICEARDREHYKIAYGIHPAANILGTDDQKQDLSEALALTKAQAREAKSGIRQFVEGIIVPEVRQSQQPIPKATEAPTTGEKVARLTSKDAALIEAAKAQALLEREEPLYQPSMLRRWPDEPSRYAYLWAIRFEQEVGLVPEDAAFMDAFEQTSLYQNNYKALYDTKLELRNFRRNQFTAAG